MASIPEKPGRSAPLPGAGTPAGAGPIAGHAAQALKGARRWLAQFLVLFVALPLVLLARLAWLAVVEGRPASAPAEISLAPPRADIVDRNGRTLARTFDAIAIAADPTELVGDPETLSHAIAAILPDSDPAQIAAALTGPGRFQYIAHRVLPAEAKRINALGEPAIFVHHEAERLYPNMQLAAHVLGYTNAQGRGDAGIEQQFESRLADPKLRNQPLVLSLDIRVQQALEEELGTVFAEQQARNAGGVIMDINTGEVLAMASFPSFNPNRLTRGDTEKYNNVTGNRFELGSTMKAVTIASGLEAGTIPSLLKRYDATQPWAVPGKVIKDHHPAQNRWLNVAEIFRYSSNIGAARIAEEVGRERQKALFEQLGFFRPVDIELPERVQPDYLSDAAWTRLSMLVLSYGQSIDLSLLHMANAYATMTNGGIFRSPTILKREQVPEGRRVLSPATSEALLKIMRVVVKHGTGKEADAPGYRLGGKTGTAARRQEGGGYNDHSNIANFVGVFPVDQPRYVIMAMVEDPKGSQASHGLRTAGWVIAPAIKRIIERIGPQLGVVPDLNRDIDTSGLLPAKAGPVE